MKHDDSTSVRTDEDELVKSQMEQMVDSYDSYMRKMTLGRERTLRERTVTWAQVRPGDCVLEVGCGTGTLTLAAGRQAGPTGQVHGIDIIPGMVEASQRKAAQANLDADFRLGSMEDVPFPADHFDVVMCSFMIFHMSEEVRRKGIAEIHRVLKPQGRLLVLDLAQPTHPLPRRISTLLFRGMLEHDLRELLPLLRSSGFSNVEVRQAPFRLFGLSLLAFARGTAQKS